MGDQINVEELLKKLADSNNNSQALYILAASIFSVFLAIMKHHYGLKMESACCSKKCSLDVKGIGGNSSNHNSNDEVALNMEPLEKPTVEHNDSEYEKIKYSG